MFEIKNCYDSHTHFVATGQVSLGLKLQDLTSSEDIKNKIIKPEHFQGHWLVGFGWDHNQWVDSSLPTKEILDRIFPDTPVLFSRVDGHASWVNSRALTELNQSGTGLLLEQDHIAALVQLPRFSETQLKSQIRESIRLFNQAGFTHVRDLSMNFQTATLLNDFYMSHELTLCLDGFMTAENIKDLARAFADFEKCRMINNPYLRFHGLKFFVDGSLGSETAFISSPYTQSQKRGITTWEFNDIKAALNYCWSRKVEVAVHVIGDSAVEMVVQAAREVSASGVLGQLHLEHVQLVQPKTIHMMKPLHVRCHMQPCHWLSDKKWIRSKIGDLSKHLFQWELLRKNKIPISFGSDSPIEPTSLIRNFQALKDSAQHNIPRLGSDPLLFHAHPDSLWTKSKTLFNEEKILEVHFDGKRII